MSCAVPFIPNFHCNAVIVNVNRVRLASKENCWSTTQLILDIKNFVLNWFQFLCNFRQDHYFLFSLHFVLNFIYENKKEKCCTKKLQGNCLKDNDEIETMLSYE